MIPCIHDWYKTPVLLHDIQCGCWSYRTVNCKDSSWSGPKRLQLHTQGYSKAKFLNCQSMAESIEVQQNPIQFPKREKIQLSTASSCGFPKHSQWTQFFQFHIVVANFHRAFVIEAMVHHRDIRIMHLLVPKDALVPYLSHFQRRKRQCPRHGRRAPSAIKLLKQKLGRECCCEQCVMTFNL